VIVRSIDFESFLLGPGRMAPKAVCLTFKSEGDQKPYIVHAKEALPYLESMLLDETSLFTGVNLAYDMALACANYPTLLPPIFRAYDNNRCTDIKIRQQLIDIAAGRFKGALVDGVWHKRDFSLAGMSRRLLGKMAKKEGFRLFYQFFYDYPLEQWVDRAKELQTLLQDPTSPEYLSLVDIQLNELPGLLAAHPTEVISYALEDADLGLQMHLGQDRHSHFLMDQYRQSRYAFWQHLMSAHGIHTDPAAVLTLKADTEARLAAVQDLLVTEGLVRKDGSRDTKKAAKRMVQVCLENGVTLKRTKSYDPKKHGPDECVCLDKDACKESEDDILVAYSDYTVYGAVLNKDIPLLMSGARVPISPRYDLAETGRSTCSGPNLMNLRRLPGIREAFIPRKGKIFAQADFAQLELYAHGQVCIELFGFSKLADTLNAGRDPHAEVASNILGMPYEWVIANKKREDVENARQTGKVANFGFPGGLGPKRLVYFAKKTYGVILTEDRAKELKEIWQKTFPEMKLYMAYIGAMEARQRFAHLVQYLPSGGTDDVLLALSMCKFSAREEKDKEAALVITESDIQTRWDRQGWGVDTPLTPELRREIALACLNPEAKVYLEQLYVKRYRGGATYTAACNSYFQGLGADVAKFAGWQIAKACYATPDHILFGCRIVMFVHDEFVLEVPDDGKAHDRAKALEAIMVDAFRAVIEDVGGSKAHMKIKAEPCLMRYYSKGALTRFDANKRLIVWNGEYYDKDGTLKTREGLAA
jgi:DNA polymerase-1